MREIAESELAPIVAEPKWSRIGLVNNAGAIGSMRALEQADPLQVASVFAVNAVAPIFLTGFVIRIAPLTMPLRIVNVSTGAAVQAIPGIGDYGSSKAALRLASMTFAAELASSERPAAQGPTHRSSATRQVSSIRRCKNRRADRPWNRLFVDFHAQGSSFRRMRRRARWWVPFRRRRGSPSSNAASARIKLADSAGFARETGSGLVGHRAS
jgi:NAD(P)-dependent dehydrogenase (short-subunit alcohol dehydrogenase family)